MSVYAGERVDLNTHDVDLQAGGTVSAFAGDKATLVAGAGGISADSAGDVKIRTGDHSLELDSAGPARLMSKGQVRLDSRTLAATAGEVALTGGNSNADIARLTVQLDCTVSPEACVDGSRVGMLDELSQIIGVKKSRLRIRQVADVPDVVPAPTPGAGSGTVSFEDTARLPGQFGRRLQSESDAEEVRERFGTGRKEHERTARQLGLIKDVKKKIMKQLLAYFKATPSAGAARKSAMTKALAFESQDAMLELWGSLQEADGGVPAGAMASFVAGLALIDSN
jgi:hypothetical protein